MDLYCVFFLFTGLNSGGSQALLMFSGRYLSHPLHFVKTWLHSTEYYAVNNDCFCCGMPGQSLAGLDHAAAEMH